MNRHQFWLTALGVGAVSFCVAQAPGTALPMTWAMHPKDSAPPVCYLGIGNDCLSVSKIPPKVCRVTQGSTSLDGCAVDGMKLIGKFETGGKQRI